MTLVSLPLSKCDGMQDDVGVERNNLFSHQHDKHEKKKFDIGNLIKYLIFYFSRIERSSYPPYPYVL